MQNDTKEISYKNTLNLPKTDFPIRANHAQEDAQLLERWNKEDLSKKVFYHNKGQEKFILSDGPPYANGHLHLGHAYNKVLKDIVAKSQRMLGKNVPVIPVWDCHGLPIEIQVTKIQPELHGIALIKACRDFARRWVDIQREEFKKLGIFFYWDKPRLTMDFAYEASILKAFGIFVEKGYIEKKQKTVPWCFSCKTVLATAEIEYQERKDPSIYVRFPLTQQAVAHALPSLQGKKVSLVVWTTTPWTLPLNRAVLLKPNTKYSVVENNGEYLLMGSDLVNTVTEKAGIAPNVVDEFLAEKLENQFIQHPFVEDLAVPVILDPFVSTDEGTACVHCAPGCGPQDYDVALAHGLEIFSPLSAEGTYIYGIQPQELEGLSIIDGQGWVIKKLIEKDKLFHKESIKHSYPHCWRCHNGLMFRATRQWFCNLEHDNLKERALQAIESIVFLPEKMKNSLKATIENRKEWCLSRQRSWGVPIPALVCSYCETPYITQELIKNVEEGIRHEGIEFWDRVTISQLGLNDLVCTSCGKKEMTKEKDILDVWFDSGISHFAVLRPDPDLAYPADMYLEGVDQHRGWFQSSLLTSLVIEPTACMKSILTHGFTVDEHGYKMSKSRGNVVSPQEMVDKIGTDGLRLWVASIDYESDAIVSQNLINNVEQVYRKIRNTCRFLLSNLYDFDINKDKVALEKLRLIDKYALERLFELNYDIQLKYENCDFTGVFHEIADYVTNELSSLYLDIIKDRLYVEKADGILRRSAQTVCWYILDTLTRLMAPILSFTAEQLSDFYQKNKAESIHLQSFTELNDVWKMMIGHVQETSLYSALPAGKRPGIIKVLEQFEEYESVIKRKKMWDLLLKIRSEILKAIEKKREKGIIKHPLEVRLGIKFVLSKQDMNMLQNFFNELELSGQTAESFFKEFCIISKYEEYDEDDDYDYDEDDDFEDEDEDDFEDEDEDEDFDEDEDEDYEDYFEGVGIDGLKIYVEKAAGQKCPRCWQYEVSNNPQHLCKRCQEVIGHMPLEA